MTSENNPYDEVTARFYKMRWVILILLISLICFLSSCSGSRKVTKYSSKSDSTVVIKTESTKDSTFNTSTVTKTETEINNDIQSEDNYTEKTTETTRFDKETGKPIETVTTKEKTGIKKEKDLTKTKQNTDVKDTTATHYKTIEKTDNQIKVSKVETKKDVDAQHGFFTTGNVIGGIVFILLIVIIYFVYRWAKSKVKI